jgi:Tol biopolymer transport system component/DNA-binding winged helix-turn-helix (wHTH) protein
MSANFSSIYPEFKLNVVKDEKKTSYAFEDYRLNALQAMLYHNGKEVSLPPKAVETLLVLVKHQGAIISKEELIKQVWKDTVVEESNLIHYLSVLRKTLGETHDGKPYIETFRRRGYRFNGEVRLLETAASENGSATPEMEQISTLPRHDVERSGNVLKVVDWQEPEHPLAVTLSAGNEDEKSSLFKNFSIGKSAILAALVVLLIASFFYLRSRVSRPQQSVANVKSELTILRLTNGAAPADATISPDGKYFVYHESDGSVSHFWLQQTGQSNRVEIIPPMLKLIRGKTFSPDGGFIYFVAQDKLGTSGSLYRVPTLGGVQSKILDDIDAPVSFSPDGKEMVFRRFNEQTRESRLIIAPSTGGEERVLLRWTAEQGILGFPAWSPKGNLIAFSTANTQSSQPITCTILGINPQTGATETLSSEHWDTCYRIAWTHDGQGLVFIGTKFGEGYSTQRDQVYYLSYPSGEAWRLTTDGNRYDVFSLGVTETDEIIALPTNRSSQIWQMNPNGDARTAVQITSGLADGRAGLATLPDGRVGYIARTGDSLNIWVANADGTNQKEVLNDPPAVEELRASPDGRFFVFSAQRNGFAHLFLMDTDGTNLRQLTFGDSYNVDSTVSPDGNWIIYCSVVVQGGNEKRSLWKIPSSGGTPILLTDKDYATPHFSPDGKFVSCVYREKEIIILSTADGSVVKTFDPVEVPQLNSGVRWTPDGQSLIYNVYQENYSNLWLQPINGGAARPLTDFRNGIIYNFAFSPDGSRLYVARGYPIHDAVLIKNFR